MSNDDLPQIHGPAPEDGQPGLHTMRVGFEVSEEVEDVAQSLIDQHPRLGFLNEHGIAYLLEHGGPPEGKKTCTWGKARLVPKWARALTGRTEACITINAVAWQVLTEDRRHALVLHELLHLGESAKTGELETVDHDVEEFIFVVAEYGAWRQDIEAFGQQLALGLSRG